MSPDRYGETEAAHSCRNGWLSAHDADVAIPCPHCRPPRKSDITDYAERIPSALAQQAINANESEIP
ncbi:hypothetical protein [Nocardia sp. NPDC051463]|uniref:hypothetical protein n=1 Tax=Nocardia sp. NPDC051463 TaxID=3154845 RepID=UPI0034505FCE